MKVIEERDCFLSNYEVLSHLRDLKRRYNWTFTAEDDKKGKDRQKRFTACGVNLEVMTRDVLQYFEKTPTGEIGGYEKFKTLMEFLAKFDLLKAEKLQIANLLPRLLVHLYAIVEECEDRFGEESSEEICTTIGELFPLADGDEEMEE